MERTEINIVDAITENPVVFYLGNRRYFLYPPTLGKTLILSRLIDRLGISMDNVQANPYAEAYRLAEKEKDLVCRIIAYHTFKRKTDILDYRKVMKQADRIGEETDTESLASLLVAVLTGDSMQEFVRHYGFDKEAKIRARIAAVKKDKGSITFGGKTVYGTVIDWACERYGWTMDYVLWGVSYLNLRMLMQDAISSVYLSKEERAKAKIYDNNEVINADDPRNRERIMEMLKNQ